MKRLIIAALAVTTFSFHNGISQTASTICIEELKTALTAVDQRAWIQSEKVFLAEYVMTYQLQSNASDKPVTVEATTLISKGIMHQTDPDQETYSTESEAYVYRPFQMVIYQVGSQFKDLWLLHQFDPGILAFSTVNECLFLQPSSTDSTLKEYRLTVNAEGQAKYNITSFVVHTNPVGNALKKIKIVYAAGAKYTFAEYQFHHIHTDAFPGTTAPDIKSYFYAADWQLLPRYGGCKVMDMRR
jgi:hypothetical protein